MSKAKQAEMFAPTFDVRRGQVWQLGTHRLMCGDAQETEDVAQLFSGCSAKLVITSPPYADCRDYTAKIPCWDTLMRDVFGAFHYADDVQMLINLGVIHRKNEWVPYWWEWLQAMRSAGWRHHSLYVWDKVISMPGAFRGRLKPAHEFVFHFNKVTVNANAWQPTKTKRRLNKHGIRGRDGVMKKGTNKYIAPYKVPNNVICQLPVSVHEATGHPAQYPAAFASFMMKTWGKDGDTVYDPFCGSASTLIAAQENNRIGYGMEIAPEYVEMALNRWAKLYPEQPPTLVA